MLYPMIFMIFMAGALLFIKVPVLLGLVVFVLALMSAAMISHIQSTWFGLALLIVYVGALLVMFAYFVSLSPNRPMSFGPVVGCGVVGYAAVLLVVPACAYTNIFSLQLEAGFLEPAVVLFSGGMLLFLAAVLFLAMVVVAKMAKVNQGPLRPFSGRSDISC